jgi:signal transduction histidine kinase
MAGMADLEPLELTRLKKRLERERRIRLEAEEIAEKVTRELYDRQEQLKRSNKELEAFSVEAQERLVRAERLAVIGQLAAGMAHDLRNPLGGMKNATYYLKRRITASDLMQSNPRIGQFLEIIEDGIHNSNKIITDLLMAFARIEPPALTPTDLVKVIEDSLSTVELKGTIRVAKQFDSELPSVMADGEQMQRVFVNLITNAQDAMPDGGELIISTCRSDGYAEVAFRDSGVGMAPETMNKIFDPLFTTKTKGTGLGLAVCQEIVSKHEGKIEVVSKPGKGATFTVRLPC